MDDKLIKPLIITDKEAQKGEDDSKVFSVRVKCSLVDEIDSIASKTNRSRNELIGILLEYAVRNSMLDVEQ